MIILLSGYKRSGKDTVADILVNKYGFKKLSFAAKLKDEVAKDYGIDRGSLDDQELKELPLLEFPLNQECTLLRHYVNETVNNLHTRRSIMILHGMMRRAVDKDYWAKTVKNSLGQGNYVISDWRFPNEKEALGEALTVRINRQASTSKDPSEISLDNYPFNIVIENKGSMEELKASVDKIISCGVCGSSPLISLGNNLVCCHCDATFQVSRTVA